MGSFCFSFSQVNDKWKQIDEFMRAGNEAVHSKAQLNLLLDKICLKYSDTSDRIRAVYSWITDNIAYDVDVYKKKKVYSAVDSVLKTRKAICAGYTRLFQYMCDELGIDCRIINGYARSGMESLVVSEDSLKVNHSWCAVNVNGKWNLIDPTWASGYTIEGTDVFTKTRNDWYYFTPPEKFIMDHYPNDPSWQLLQQTVQPSTFTRWPLVLQGYIDNDIVEIFPREGYVKKQVGDTLHFKFRTSHALNAILLTSLNNKKIYHLESLKSNGTDYQFDYVLEHVGNYDLQVDFLYLEPRSSYSQPTYQVFSITDLGYWVECSRKQ
jgi:hypothetical protein